MNRKVRRLCQWTLCRHADNPSGHEPRLGRLAYCIACIAINRRIVARLSRFAFRNARRFARPRSSARLPLVRQRRAISAPIDSSCDCR